MKYQDTSNSINGKYIGASVGTRLPDSLAPLDDGFEYIRSINHVGTILQDAIDEDQPEPIVEDEEE